MDTPVSILPNNFNLINSTINSMYKKFCDINIEDHIVSTQYILKNIKKLNLFSTFGKQYDPVYILNLKRENNHNELEANTAVFRFTIFFKKIKLITFVAFYGSIEISGENMLCCRFHRSEVLENLIIDNTYDLNGFIKEKEEYFNSLLVSKGCKVLP